MKKLISCFRRQKTSTPKPPTPKPPTPKTPTPEVSASSNFVSHYIIIVIVIFTIFVFQKIECPISIKWEIEEAKLAALKDSDGECLTTDFFEASNIPGVIYRLKCYPNDNREAWLYLGIAYGNETQVLADVTFSIESAGFCQKRSYVKDKPRGVKCCKTYQLFFPNYMVNGKLTVKCTGILSVERKSNYTDVDSDGEKWKMEGFLGSIWSGNETDFTIVVDGKCIEVSGGFSVIGIYYIN